MTTVRSATRPRATRPRVLVLSLSYRPPERVQQYVRDLVDAGVDVDLVLAETSSTEQVDLDPRVTVHKVLDIERNLPVRRIERIILYTLPGKVLGKARSLTTDKPVLRPLDLALGATRRGQRWVANKVHYKLYWPAFKVMRPWLMARKGRRVVRGLDLTGLDRIVAADAPAVPLGWRLARRYPDVRATTVLDRKPYVGEARP
jgi:hypothetical protein